MALLQLLPPLAALAGGCAALSGLAGLPAGLAPLACLAVIALVLAAAGMGGALAPAAWLLLVAGLLAGGAAALVRLAGCRPGLCARLPAPLARAVRRRGLAPAADGRPGFSLAAAAFWGGALVLAVRFAAVQPQLVNYDEYSFWGTAARLTSLNGRLYTECTIGTPWQITQTPSVPLLSYFAQLCGPYADWKLIWAVDLLLLAGAAAVAECARGWRLQLPAALAALLAPFVLVLTSHTSVLTTPYLEAMGDTAVGVLFGGAVAFWWALRRQSPRLWWLMLPVACLVGSVKDNTFVLGLAAAGIAAADLLLFGLRDDAPRLTGKRLAARCGGALALLAAPAVQYLAWGRYTAALVAQNAQTGGMGSTSQPLAIVLVEGVKLFLGLPAADYYTARRETAFAYADTLADWFLHHDLSLLGSGAAVVGVIGLLFLGAVLLAPTVRGKLRAALTALCSAACFGGYWLMLLLSYAFILKDSTPENPVSYNRYFQSYYVGWFLLALAVFLAAASAAQRPARSALGRAGALAVSAVFCGLCFTSLEPQYTVFGVTPAQYAPQRQTIATAEWAAAQIPKGERVYLICQGDDGYHWFEYSCRLLPHILVYGDGGGTYGLPEYTAGSYYLPRTAAQLHAAVQDSGAAWLLVARSDELFERSYAELFSDGLAAAADGAAALYRVADGGFVLAAVQTEAGEGGA